MKIYFKSIGGQTLNLLFVKQYVVGLYQYYASDSIKNKSNLICLLMTKTKTNQTGLLFHDQN